MNHVVQTIVISHEKKKIKIIMYDAVNDILLRSNHIELFYMDCKSFYKDRIIIMRMVMHYRPFEQN